MEKKETRITEEDVSNLHSDLIMIGIVELHSQQAHRKEMECIKNWLKSKGVKIED